MPIHGAEAIASTEHEQAMTTLEIFATAPPGLESVVCQEVANLSGRSVDGVPGGALLRGNLQDAAGLVLYSRTASRILVRLGTVPSGSLQELAQRADKLPWSDFLAPGQPVKVRATVRGGKIRRRDAVEERIASCARHGTRGQGSQQNRWPQEFVVRVMGRETTISADAAGLLHKRGYRQATAKAPLRENLAAALLMAADWHPSEPLIDPFCGSGTFAIEAAWMAQDLPPGRKHRPALANWPSAPKGLWEDLLAIAAPEQAHPAWIRGSDRDEGAIRAARGNAQRAGVTQDIQLECCDVRSLAPPEVDPGLVICNLPWGKRIGDPKKLRGLYSTFGAALRERLPGWRLAVLCPDRALAGCLVPRMDERHRFEIGGLQVGFYCGVIPSR